jgi:hypothetical protein
MNNCQDLVILIDVTASMKPCMEALKKNISSLIETLENLKNHNDEKQFPNWRMMIAGYRDAVANPSNWFVQFPFTNDVNQLYANLSHPDMECKGGGDEPESLLDALYKLTADMPHTGNEDEPDGLKWRSNLRPVSCRRVISFFTDASFKPVTAIPLGKTASDIADAIENINGIYGFFKTPQQLILPLAEDEGLDLETVKITWENRKMDEDMARLKKDEYVSIVGGTHKGKYGILMGAKSGKLEVCIRNDGYKDDWDVFEASELRYLQEPPEKKWKEMTAKEAVESLMAKDPQNAYLRALKKVQLYIYHNNKISTIITLF